MTNWRRSSNSLDEFIHECCDLGSDKVYERRRALYGTYKRWCAESGRKPFSNSSMKALLEHRIGLGVRFAVLDGYDIVRGICVKESYRDPTLI